MNRVLSFSFRMQQTKGLLFMTAIICLYSIVFFYIGISTIIGGVPFLEVGSPLFLLFAFYDFGVHTFYFLKLIYYAARCN